MRYTNKYKFIGIHILLCLLAYSYYVSVPYQSIDNLKMMGLFGWLALGLTYYGWYKITNKIFVPYIVFVTAAYVFAFGQSFLYVFDLVAKNRDLLESFTGNEIYDAQILTIIFMQFFHIGAIVAIRKNKSIKLAENSLVELNAIKRIGWIVTLISVIPFFAENIFKMVMVSRFGYEGAYMKIEGGPIIQAMYLLSDFFIPGLLCLLLSTKIKSFMQHMILCFLVIVVLFILYCGGRSQGVILVGVVLLYFHNYVKAFNYRQMLLIAVGGFFFVSLLSAIAHLRSESRKNFVENVVEYQSDENPFFETISEMGASMYPLVRTMALVPASDEDYRYGSTYLFAMTSLIPNLGFWDVHPAKKYGNVGDWLVEKDNMTYGPGYSIVAEAYINWGYLGFLLMFIIGFFFYRILNIDKNSHLKILPILISLIFCYMSLKMVRNSFIGTVRVLAYYILPIYLYVNFQVKRKKLLKVKERHK